MLGFDRAPCGLGRRMILGEAFSAGFGPVGQLEGSVLRDLIVCLWTGVAFQLKRGSRNRGSMCADENAAFAIV
jgi:hypothetical protein